MWSTALLPITSVRRPETEKNSNNAWYQKRGNCNFCVYCFFSESQTSPSRFSCLPALRNFLALHSAVILYASAAATVRRSVNDTFCYYYEAASHARSAQKRPTVTDVAWCVCVCTRLSVGYNCEPRRNGWTDRGAVVEVWTHVGPQNRVFDGARISRGTGRFWGHTWPCPYLPTVDILNLVRQEAAAIRLFAVNTAATY